MPDLYVAMNSPNCRSVLMALKAANVEGVELKNVNLKQGEHKSEDYIKLNPFGKVPTLDDSGFHLWESRAIMMYLCDKYGKNCDVYPKDPKERAIVEKILFFDIEKLQSGCAAPAVAVLLKGEKPTDEDCKQAEAVVEKLDCFLKGKQYLCGDTPTLADFACLSSVSLLEAVSKFDFSKFPNVKAWVERAKQLPYYNECNEEWNKFAEEARSKSE